MPIEILELVIKAKVADPNAAESGNQAPASNDQIDKAALKPVVQSVQAILDILKRKNER
ncbi:MAG: hypothetical protein IPM98_12220 [Lewinellaceae bacterium]|nr:hypothetical protein [Lewinellaceae bacterium]